jgi:glyoxylase-like metal-dependent hydrolase (beta-lactamase superfamily II)
MSRARQITQSATWWPSVLWQTTTLEIVRDGQRLLVDPGIAPWEVAEAARDGAAHVLITHADWDHVMGIGLLPDAQVWAGAGAAQRIRSGEARASVESQARVYGVPLEGLDGLRADHVLAVDQGPFQLGPWNAECHSTTGHTPDGVTTWLPDEGLLIVGDYLSEQEVPFIYDSAWNYRETLRTLLDLIERHAPEHVVVGHGSPHTAARAAEIAHEDLEYVERLISHAESGGSAEADIPYPQRGGASDPEEHRANVVRTCERLAV